MKITFFSILALAFFSAATRAPALPVDTVSFGVAESEKAHALAAELSEITKGGLEEPARTLLPRQPVDWQGGKVAFTMKVDPALPNYFTVKLWGGDQTRNRLTLFCEGKQVGYRHLGDIDMLDIGGGEAGCAGRYYYVTTPLPVEMTRGKTALPMEIRASGAVWGYAAKWEDFQKVLKEPTRGIYAGYTHTDGFFEPPPGEKQGAAPANPPVRKTPGEEVLAQVKEKMTKELNGILKAKKPVRQEQIRLAALGWWVKWSPAFQNPDVVVQLVKCGDEFFRNYRKDPKVAENDPRTPNPEWFGLGLLAESIHLLREPLQPLLAEKMDDGKLTRREAWTEMLKASREFLRTHRRQYTNQSMIVDLNIYRSNSALAAITPAEALPEAQARRYLHEAIGLQPWLGSETANGPARPLGDAYYQLTAKGLTKELGFVGYYGEVLDWVTQIYLATCEPGKPASGDPAIRAQLARMELARGVFRYPLADNDGNRAMRAEAVVGWRDDSHYPGDVTYGERAGRQGSALYSPAATLDPRSVGFAQQMFADNQFFATVEEQMKEANWSIYAALLAVPDEYELLRAQPASRFRLPMTPGMPDFAWADEEDGVLAVKNGDEILYVSLYWRARHGINGLARMHHITPHFDRIGVVREDTQFEPSGLEYKRPDWINFGFANGGPRYPGDLHSAHTGEKLPIAKIPDGLAFKPGQESIRTGKASFYQLRYGPCLIGMNTTKDKNFALKTPPAPAQAPELVSHKTIALTGELPVAPRSTVALYLGGAK